MANLWYEGDIAAAVQRAKSLGAIFVVFVEGKNEVSDSFKKLFENVEITTKLMTKHFIAIKIEAESLAHQQFSQIYPNGAVPSIYFIGKNGTALETVTENIDLDTFKTTIKKVLEKGGIDTSQSQPSETLISSEKNENVSPSTSKQTATPTQRVSDQPELTLEEKTKLTQELIEKKRLEKLKEEAENERLKEIERRKVGQSTQGLKKWQQEEQLKQQLDERQREKRENQEARSRVLAQIAQDKAERAARFSSQPIGLPTTSQSAPQSSRPSPNSNAARLQFRLPDGRSNTHDFDIADTLQTVRNYISSDLNLNAANYTLSTTFPRREFTANDNSQTLLDLQLVPNAVILVLPINRGAISTNTNNAMGNLFWMLMTPLFNLYGFLKSFVFGTPQNPSGEGTSNASGGGGGKRVAGDNEDSERKHQKRRSGETTVVRKQGNVHRLQDRPDSDDENNTWNGNSTQQM